MTKLALLPLITATMSAVLTWAMARYVQMASEHRANAHLRPRSRPYDVRLPASLDPR